MKRALLAVGVVSALALAACTNGGNPTPRSPIAPSPDVQSVRPNSIERVVQYVLPAVVNVVAGEGEGTGFIVRDDGIIVTNYHVVEGASSVTVLTSDEEPDEYTARVIGGDIQADLAILDVDAQDLPTVPLGDSDGLRLGQQVVAIGYALGLEGGPSVTAGIVSWLAERSACRTRTAPSPSAATVTSACTPTRSRPTPPSTRKFGSPLVDLAGNVVGINSAGANQAENVGFGSRSTRPSPRSSRPRRTPTRPSPSWGSARRTWATRRCSSRSTRRSTPER